MVHAAEICNIELGFFAGYANSGHDRYDIYAELKNSPGDDIQKQFIKELDELLGKNNIEYDTKRKSERLALPVLIPLKDDAFAKFRELRLAEGALEGQLKWIQLFTDETVKDKIASLAKV
jgi:hypothetical protein